MGDASTLLSAADGRHLLRRTGFGAPANAVAKFAGLSRGAAADRLLNFRPGRFRPRGQYIEDVHNSWLRYMLRTGLSLQEKLVLFWHDHFATGSDKVGDPKLMGQQNQLLRQYCTGDFKAFVKAMNKNPAMMEYLDTVRNDKSQPNENYARELQELFTLGVQDSNGNPNYEQEDIVQIARAFSGWSYDRHDKATFDQYGHDFAADYPERGAKVVYRTHGGFGAAGRDFTQPGGEGPLEIDQVIDAIFEHRDSDGQKTVARYITRKLFTYLANPSPTTALVDQLIADSGFGNTNWSIAGVVRAMLTNDAFYATGVPAPFDASTQKSVKWPADYVVTTMRLLNVRARSRWQYISGGSYTSVRDHLTAMGQTLLDPPSVFGWDWETAWLSSATLLARYTFARDVTVARYSTGRTAFRPEKLISLSLTDPGQIVDAVTDLLGITDQFTASERQAFIDYLGGPLDLHDYNVRNTKLHGLFALVLQSPVYQVH